MYLKVKVPATTANLGPGFDVLGAALSLYNEFEVEYVPNAQKTNFILKGEGKKTLPKNNKNLVWQSMCETFKILNETRYNLKNLNITINASIPLNRGLGSSAATIVGGIILANALSKNKLNTSQIANLAIKIEGHPDNVIPAIYGGVCICCKDKYKDHETVVQLPIPKLKVVLCVPTFEVKTKQSRQILPKYVNLGDAIFNISRVTLLTAAFYRADYSLLSHAMQDKIHQPYRGKMIPVMNEVLNAAIVAGAYGAYLSGSGPTLAALCDKKNIKKVSKAMTKRWEKENISTRTYIADFNRNGVLKI
ncbi:MAG: homoserine kinase [Endomicrobium sp.]|jgi:homoserine kinase|nr:homoserine kinase [Endomicrobium sp.]